MKNLLISSVFFCFFLLGSPYLYAYGGAEGVIVGSKSAKIVCIFELPKDQNNKDNHLVITVINEKSNVVLSMESKDLNVFLPINLSGTYIISINLNGHILSQKVTI